ncbi:polymorphic toxin type 23 domain-containing protein [Epilithonimonas sp.]|uniref:polymorphic toxin type 23 domain-containing protein n=1 Tax=Epilithonimonas sp. TaxID=2894511 RepID=UPI0028986D43|nr:polymorphic toxin type 23 domain-containing protein [Epilithonimonas sp.]
MKKIYILLLIPFFNLYFNQSLFQDTQGSIDVNGGGQLQYTLPIAIPPGIRSVAPDIKLSYTSGNGNGLVGYGWSLSGITSISRTGKTLDKDSEVSGVNLNYSPFQFNGQRLIYKSGGNGPPYGGVDGTTYITDKYSNIQIKVVGTIYEQNWQGPASWEVTFEDGSQAWYGATSAGVSSARTPVEYNIVKWKDAQGNYITYNYAQTNNVAVISSIEWGGNETLGKPHFNAIYFNYITRDLKETSYINGVQFIQDKLLSSILVTGNGSQFKRYVVNYSNDIVNNDTNQTVNYQYVKSIQEFNSQDEPANPVTFNTKPLVITTQEKAFGDFNNVITTGDYNGDGLIDFIVKQPAQNGRPEGYYLYFDAVNNATSSFVYLGASNIFDSQSILTYNIKPSDGYIKPKQGLLVAKSQTTTYPTPATGDIELKYYSIKSDTSVLNTTNNPLVLEYSKTVDPAAYVFADSQYPPYSTPSNYGISKLSQFENPKEVDIDSDGMSELVFGLKDSRCFKSQISPYSWSCNDLGYRYVVIDNSDLQSTTIHKLSNVTSKNILSKGGIMDFDNDGKQDIIFIEPNVGNVNVSFYTTESTGSIVQKNLSVQSNKISQYFLMSTGGSYAMGLKNTFNVKGLDKYIQFADLNGDRNIEILAPLEKGDYYSTRDMGWSISLNDGKTLSESFQGLVLFRDDTAFTYYSLENDYPTAFDIDNDGKSEFVMFYNAYSSYYNQSKVGIANLREFQYNPNNIQFKWSYKKYFNYNLTVGGQVLYPIYGDFRVNNSNSKILLISKSTNSADRKVISYQNYNLNVDKNISSIGQGNVFTEVDYKELNPAINADLYAPVKKEQYPFMELDRVSQSYAVSQLRQSGIIKQDFRYRGLITHLRGRGMVGFRQSARSSWYADGFENTKIWNGTEIDPLNESIPVKEWSIRTNDENQIFPADLSINNTQLLSFKQTTYQTDHITGVGYSPIKAIVPTQIVTKDFLKDITTIATTTYGSYYLPIQTVNNVNNGYAVSTTELAYEHNINGIGKDYYVGRPQSKNETIQVYGDTKSTKTEYAYNAKNLLKTQKIWNIDNTGWIQEDHTYDDFGNIIQKTSSNSVDGNTKTEQSIYEDKGRFVTSKKDVDLNLTTVFTYNNWGQVLTQTDPLGVILTHSYDNWGKLISSGTNLSGTTLYYYDKFDTSNPVMGSLGIRGTQLTETQPDGNVKITLTNILGQQYKTITKDFQQNIYVVKAFNFDAIGRKIAESEPFKDNSFSYEYLPANPSTWNTITYDDSVYPSRVTAQSYNNGKKIETLISGRTTFVKELNGYSRITSKTIDEIGNIISSTDKGGTINYAYNAAGQQISATYGTNVVTTSYDAWGRRVSFNDPANGLYQFEYNDGFGKVTREISPKGYKQYTYKTNGLLESTTELSNDGISTNKQISIVYNPKWQVISKTGTSNGKAFSNTITYDAYGRPSSIVEQFEGRTFFRNNLTYDAVGRPQSYEQGLVSNGVTTSTDIVNNYSSWSGDLYQVKQAGTNKILWELQTTNAKGQVLTATLGASQITNTYDGFGFLQSAKHITSTNNLVEVNYVFNAVKNELTERHHFNFGLDEYFAYDGNNRLISWTNPNTGLQSSNEYDYMGRIISNDQVGKVKYDISGNIYRPSSLKLNTNGLSNYGIGEKNILLQNIRYNENNDPIKIRGRQNDYTFEYGLTESRQIMNYGGKFEDSQDSQFTKYYSEDGSMEVVRDNATGQEKHILYIGGSPYESNIIYLKDFTGTTGSFKYLHKDYLGSVLAISDDVGNAVERRHFDAWGIFTHLQKANGNIITNQKAISASLLLIDRGYTSHEHLLGVQLIHMNGRLYDPLLRRFLNADENIQDPYNTQIYNKYGYVMNNPLLYNDLNGEWFGLDDLIVAGVSFVIGYVSHGIMTGNWGWDAVKSGLQMAVMGWLSYNTCGIATAGSGAITGSAGSAMWNFVGNSAINTAISCVVPPANISIGKFDFSISPSVAIGKGWGFGANVSATFHAGDFSLSGGIGLMEYGGHAGSGKSGSEYRKSLMIGYDDGKFGINAGTNIWSGLHEQRTGVFGFRYGKVSFSYENDYGLPFSILNNKIWADGNDSFRTAAARLSIGDFHAGFNLFTGQREDYSGDDEKVGKMVIDKFGRKMPNGYVKEFGPRYRFGGLYAGWGNYRFGVNSEHVRHAIQDHFAHNFAGKHQPGFENLSWDWKPYFQYQTINRFTSW